MQIYVSLHLAESLSPLTQHSVRFETLEESLNVGFDEFSACNFVANHHKVDQSANTIAYHLDLLLVLQN